MPCIPIKISKVGTILALIKQLILSRIPIRALPKDLPRNGNISLCNMIGIFKVASTEHMYNNTIKKI